MVHWLEIIYFLLLLLAIFRCLYFWQLKEYRFDRFREFVGTAEARAFWWPGRRFFRPRLTVKILLLVYLSVYFSVLLIRYLPHQLPAPVLAYFFVPLSTGAAVAVVNPISDVIKRLAVILARIKLLVFHRRLLVIGITGSYGKTSTKEILARLLAAKFRTAKTRDTNNTLIGIAKAVLFTLKPGDEMFVVEMGAYKIGEIKAICRLVKPKVGILTGINQQHLALFGSLENTIRAKTELVRSLPADGLAVINGVNPITKKITASAPTKYYCAGRYKTNLLGRHQQLNISAAVTVAKYLGVKSFNLNIPHFKTAITKLKGLNGAVIINDSYNSNPDGFLAAVALAKSISARRKILISPGIIELGSASRSIHQRLEKAAGAVFDQVIFSKRDNVSENQLLNQLRQILTKNDLLLIEGRFSPKFIKAICSNPS